MTGTNCDKEIYEHMRLVLREHGTMIPTGLKIIELHHGESVSQHAVRVASHLGFIINKRLDV